jgi:hypothetical protein
LTHLDFTPITRISMPGERAAIAFLASDEVWYIHGVARDVTGSRFGA